MGTGYSKNASGQTLTDGRIVKHTAGVEWFVCGSQEHTANNTKVRVRSTMNTVKKSIGRGCNIELTKMSIAFGDLFFSLSETLRIALSIRAFPIVLLFS